MAEPPAKKTSSYYMKRMRAGLAEAGYVKHDAWVLPENRGLLKQIEKKLRQPVLASSFSSSINWEAYMTTTEKWTLEALFGAIKALDAVASGEIAASLVQGAEPSIKLDMRNYGDLPVYIAVVGEQIVVDTVLVEQDAINDVRAFNEAVLRSRELFPLSSIGIENMPNGQTVYNLFGALSADSSLTNVVTEVFALAENAEHAVEAFEDFFIKN